MDKTFKPFADQTKHREQTLLREMFTQLLYREDRLQRHIPECKGIGDRAVRIEMPEKRKNDIQKLDGKSLKGTHRPKTQKIALIE